MLNNIIINTGEGYINVNKEWIEKQLNDTNNKWSLVSNTYFVTNNGNTWSIEKEIIDNIKSELRNNKINTLLN